MKCWKCDKEMSRAIIDAPTIKGISVTVEISEAQATPDTINYNNTQLGKYSDGQGECHVGICYECYIDGLFNLTK